MFHQMRETTVTKLTIFSKWQKTGLILYNLGVVICKIQTIQDDQLVITLFFCLETPFPTRIPRALKELVNYGKNIQKNINKYYMIYP